MSTQKKIQGVESIAVKEFFGDYGDQLKLPWLQVTNPFQKYYP